MSKKTFYSNESSYSNHFPSFFKNSCTGNDSGHEGEDSCDFRRYTEVKYCPTNIIFPEFLSSLTEQ